MSTAERLDKIEEQVSRLLGMMEAFNARVAGLENGKQDVQQIEPMDAEPGDRVGSAGFYISQIEPGENAVLSVNVDWGTFLEATNGIILRH